MEYELYHDESKEHGYWHGILLVPTSTKPMLTKYLIKIRKVLAYNTSLSLKQIKNKGKSFKCAEAWVLFAYAALMQRIKKDGFPTIKLPELERGQLRFGNYSDLIGNYIIGCKFIVLRDRDLFNEMYDTLDFGAKMEITFRMAVKGGIHLLGSDEKPIEIKKMYFDGHKHYGRNINNDRIKAGLNKLRKYCEISDDLMVYDDKSDHDKNTTHSYEDCQILQLTDLLIGSARVVNGYYGQGGDSRLRIQKEIASPVKELLKKYNKGIARMKNSRWSDAICIGECFLENGEWQFAKLERKQKKKQLNLWCW